MKQMYGICGYGRTKVLFADRERAEETARRLGGTVLDVEAIPVIDAGTWIGVADLDDFEGEPDE